MVASANKLINSLGAKSDMIIVVVISVIFEGLFTSEWLAIYIGVMRFCSAGILVLRHGCGTVLCRGYDVSGMPMGIA